VVAVVDCDCPSLPSASGNSLVLEDIESVTVKRMSERCRRWEVEAVIEPLRCERELTSGPVNVYPPEKCGEGKDQVRRCGLAGKGEKDEGTLSLRAVQWDVSFSLSARALSFSLSIDQSPGWLVRHTHTHTLAGLALAHAKR
jgi:hypothetical protein